MRNQTNRLENLEDKFGIHQGGVIIVHGSDNFKKTPKGRFYRKPCEVKFTKAPDGTKVLIDSSLERYEELKAQGKFIKIDDRCKVIIDDIDQALAQKHSMQ